MSERPSKLGVCGHPLRGGRKYCSISCSRKAWWASLTAEQRRAHKRYARAGARKRWTPEERRRVAEKQTKPEDYKRGYNTGWAACERFYRQVMGDRFRPGRTTDDMGANEASNTRNPSSPSSIGA